jgi:ABC-2 type transport system ATP-binding protein
MNERRVARAMAAIAVVTLALVSLPRLRLEYAPDVVFPELVVSLQLPPTANADSQETTRQWVIPIENALRAAGETTGTRGDIGGGSATVVARFRRGTDVELKAARVTSDLAPLRARLPEGASLAVFPARSGVRPSVVFAVTGPAAADAAERLAVRLRSTPGVREVQTFGTRREEIDVHLSTDAPVSRADVARDLLPRPLGEAMGEVHRVPVVAQPAAPRIEELPALGDQIDRIVLRREEPSSLARLDGRPAATVAVFRDDETPLLAFDRAVRRGAGGATTLWSDAAELRTILVYLGIALLIAAVVLRNAYIPLSIALLVNVWSVAAMRVDTETLVVSAVAIAAVAPFAAVRPRWPLVLFALLPPVAAALSSAALAPLLLPAARAFTIAVLCAAVAAFAMPQRRRRIAWAKPLLRRSASLVLAALAVAVFFLSWFGPRLDPRRASGSSDRSRMYLRLRLPSGTTLAQTTLAAAAVENAVRDVPGIERSWTSVSPGNATIVADVARAYRSAQRFSLLQIALRAQVPAAPGALSIESSLDRGSSALAESVEQQPFADEDGSLYRFLLKGTDAAVVRRAAESVTTRLTREGIPRDRIHGAWPEPSPRIELVAAKAWPPALADAAAGELARLSVPPEGRELPDGKVLRVATRDAPQSMDDVPRRAELFARPLSAGDRTFVVGSAFEARLSSTEGEVTREMGRFVLPVDVSIRTPSRDETIAKRNSVDRALAVFQLPAGVIAERPPLATWAFSAAKLRLAAVAAFLPLLMFTAAAIALSSLARAAAALVPGAVALALVAPVLAAASAQLDEMTLLAAGAALCAVTAMAVVALLRIEGSAARTYRFIRAHAAGALTATAAGGALLAIAAVAPVDIGDAWRAPLLAAAAIVIAGMPAALFLPAASALLVRETVRGRAAVRSYGGIWAGEGLSPQLAIRNVTKVYAGGFRALYRVNFELAPGVVGLLGPNGAGKTTLLRILTGLLRPTRGTVSWCGVGVRPENVAEFRRFVGFMPQEFNAYAGLTAAQFLDFWALERGIGSPRERREHIGELLAVVGLEEHANRHVRDFSGGMRQRIGIARALLGDPPLLIVDEPTTGLDIEARRRFRDLLLALARQRIVVLSSHIAGDIESTAARLLVLVRGELRWDGSIDGLLSRARGRVFETTVPHRELRGLAERYRITTRIRVAGGVRVRGVAPEGEALPGNETAASLEEAYLALVMSGSQTSRRGSPTIADIPNVFAPHRGH